MVPLLEFRPSLHSGMHYAICIMQCTVANIVHTAVNGLQYNSSKPNNAPCFRIMETGHKDELMHGNLTSAIDRPNGLRRPFKCKASPRNEADRSVVTITASYDAPRIFARVDMIQQNFAFHIRSPSRCCDKLNQSHKYTRVKSSKR